MEQNISQHDCVSLPSAARDTDMVNTRIKNVTTRFYQDGERTQKERHREVIRIMIQSFTWYCFSFDKKVNEG